MNPLLNIQTVPSTDFRDDFSVPHYCIFVFHGKGKISIDFVEYGFSGDTVLFLSPYQNFKWLGTESIEIQSLLFHGDFYCIEYHKKEVSCNGLLFNNIYLFPHIQVPNNTYQEIIATLRKMETESRSNSPYSDAVLRSYLQLVLALCSKEKSEQLEGIDTDKLRFKETAEFQNLLDRYFLDERSVAFYAGKVALTPNTFSKKIKQQFGKTPSKLIQGRVVLEAKKLLHLTQMPIKEIAAELNFQDEFYFSRYFKKEVGFSPQHYREKVGISIVAK